MTADSTLLKISTPNLLISLNGKSVLRRTTQLKTSEVQKKYQFYFLSKKQNKKYRFKNFNCKRELGDSKLQ